MSGGKDPKVKTVATAKNAPRPAAHMQRKDLPLKWTIVALVTKSP